MIDLSDRIVLAVVPRVKPETVVQECQKRIREKAKGQFLVWNFSGEEFQSREFGGQLLEFDLPAEPTVETTFRLCNEIRYWLKIDSQNIAVLIGGEEPSEDGRGWGICQLRF